MDEHRLQLAFKSILNESNDELDYWLDHFNIENQKLCQKYNIENIGYNFYFYIILKAQNGLLSHNYYENICKCTLCNKISTNNSFYDELNEYIMEFTLNYGSCKFKKYTKNNTEKILYDNYEKYFDTINSYPIFDCKCFTENKCYSCNFIIEFYNLYNLKIKFIPAAVRYKSLRRN